MAATSYGRIRSINNLTTELVWVGDKPAPRDLLRLKNDPKMLFEVQSFNEASHAICINLGSSPHAVRGRSS